jgi:hypothetical protein
MSSLRPTVLGCYKRLMRARLVAFSGDFNAIEKSRTELRMHFVNNKAAPPEAVVGMVKEVRIRGAVGDDCAGTKKRLILMLSPPSQPPPPRADG